MDAELEILKKYLDEEEIVGSVNGSSSRRTGRRSRT